MGFHIRRSRRGRKIKKKDKNTVSWTSCSNDTTENISQKTNIKKPNTFFYDMHNSTLIVLLIVVAVILALVGLYAFKYFVPKNYFTFDSNSVTAIFLGIAGVPIGVILAFIITGAWSSFNDAEAKENKEAADLLFLYRVVQQLPGTEMVQRLIIEYIEHIVNVEFPQMADGLKPTEGLDLLLEIGQEIYAFNPKTKKEEILYQESIDMYNEILSLRAARFAFLNGLAPELWWVLVLGVVSLIIMSWFVYCRREILHYIMTAFAAAVLVSLLFLIIALNFPYRGDFGLDSTPFQLVLIQINSNNLNGKQQCK